MANVISYDKDCAAKELEKLAQRRLNSDHPQMMIARLTEKNKEWQHCFQTRAEASTHHLDLVPDTSEATVDNENIVEEAVMTFHGVIQGLDLPPFKEKPNDRNNQAKYICQNVTVGGFGTATFQKVVEGVAEIHALLSRVLEHGEDAECGMLGVEEEETVLYASNRYFMPKKDAGNTLRVLFTPDVDPHGYLARIGGQQYVHTAENHVYYFERRRSGNNEDNFLPCKPVKFRVGDIVEVQVSFVVLTMREGKKKTAMVLRSLLLLEGGITDKSMVNRISELAGGKGPSTLKRLRIGYNAKDENKPSKVRAVMENGMKVTRRVGYVEEEIVTAGNRLSEMDIDERKEQRGPEIVNADHSLD